MKETRPHFFLQVDTGGCRFDIRVNDCPVLRRTEPVRIAVDLPVNPWVFTGDNEIRVEVLPPEEGAAGFHEAARCEALLYACEVEDRAKANRRLLGGLSFSGATLPAGTGFEGSPGADGPLPPRVEAFGAGGIRGTRTQPLDTPFPRWSWLDGRRIQAGPAVRAELEREYRRLWEILRNRDVAALEALLDTKAADMRAAWFLADRAAGHEYLGVREVLEEPDFHLLDLDFSGMALDVFGGARLARLVDGEEDGPLRFANADESYGCVVETTWCLSAAGWVPVR